MAEREFVPIVSVSSSISKDNRLDSVVSSSVVGTVGMKLPTGGEFSLNILQPMKIPWTRGANTGNGNVSMSFRQPLLRGAGFKINREFQDRARRNEDANILQLRNMLMGTVSRVTVSCRSFLLSQQSFAISKASLKRAEVFLKNKKVC